MKKYICSSFSLEITVPVKADIVFLLDESSSVSAQEFSLQLEWVKSLLTKFRLEQIVADVRCNGSSSSLFIFTPIFA